MTSPETHRYVYGVHHGRNVKRFRELFGISQEDLAGLLGDDWNQKKISLLEAKENLESDMLDRLARALNLPSEALKNFNEQAVMNIIGTTVTANDHATSVIHCNTINQNEKVLELLGENKRLYEALLKEKDEKIALLEKLLAAKS